jgi:hypothetical protein
MRGNPEETRLRGALRPSHDQGLMEWPIAIPSGGKATLMPLGTLPVLS